MRADREVENKKLAKLQREKKLLKLKAKRNPLWGTIDHSFSMLPGGRTEGLAYLQFSLDFVDRDGNKPNERFRPIFDLMSQMRVQDRDTVSLDTVCRNLGIDPSDAVAESVRWGMRYNAQQAQAIASACLPSVVKAVVKRAKGRNGTADARLVGEATGWLPSSKGVQINQQFVNGSSVMKDTAYESAAARGLALPSFESDTVESCEVVRDAEILDEGEAEDDSGGT